MLTHRIEQQLAPASSTPDIGECRKAEQHVLDAQQQFEEQCAPEAKVGKPLPQNGMQAIRL